VEAQPRGMDGRRIDYVSSSRSRCAGCCVRSERSQRSDGRCTPRGESYPAGRTWRSVAADGTTIALPRSLRRLGVLRAARVMSESVGDYDEWSGVTRMERRLATLRQRSRSELRPECQLKSVGRGFVNARARIGIIVPGSAAAIRSSSEIPVLDHRRRAFSEERGVTAADRTYLAEYSHAGRHAAR
jgi:hypothetical protein